MNISKIICCFVLYLLNSSCQKNQELIVSEQEILQRISVIDPKTRLLPEETQGITCKIYNKFSTCKKVLRTLFFGLEIILVEFSREKSAQIYARELKTLSLGNWIVDNIQKESYQLAKIKEAMQLDLNLVNSVPKTESKASSSASPH